MLITDLPSLPLTADEFEKIPEPDGARLELWEGNLVVMAAAQMAWHSATARRVEDLFRAAKREVLREIGVVLGPRDVPIPDVVVFREPVDLDRSQFPAADVTCVVEVISPESVNRDKNAKPAKYAAARIPEFWLVGRLPENPNDAQVEIYKLTPEGGYGLAERALLSELEER
ncbi:Uma2 family endonuclease [Allorhizocola rhizosphaerae]|uniref:Uma2 family endonuclease n=1 Tax=Allorhizocola rhizosphaerae TaxID=1872709 RepID=UPI0013C30BA1|nr:Uma2 family endonuclease [Allorhizocola rhizosphaerae]